MSLVNGGEPRQGLALRYKIICNAIKKEAMATMLCQNVQDAKRLDEIVLAKRQSLGTIKAHLQSRI
ncbi:hypothetical protein N7533_006768 [Penicillium manginii]|uniref:uncharacterized protein n=1 Tax=Penicillium manginii TaxID=203109 RepID=UPI002547FDC2|nr:uncharacterized protein N7533_006768 [Penicillium manginii]KAJ5749740.1 hypothetical protein N7533_006768 [Penicillium manginii]